MFDSTPAPFGEVTRRFTHLDEDERDRHLTRLPGDRCAGELPAHVEARRGVSTQRPPSREHEPTVVRRP
jgi:hypothetical protein